MNHWSVVNRIAGAVLVAVFLVGIVFIFLPKWHGLRELQRRKIELEEENRRTEALINEMKDKQNRFLSDAAFVERTAREMGMVKTNETVFRMAQ